MSKVKVFYSFKDVHEVAYRVEVIDGVDCVATEVVGSVTPLVIDYDTKHKLDVVRSSGVTLGMISDVMFALQSLYTDNMLQYVVRVFRDGELFWLGYLDSELYEEDFSEFDRYAVSFTGADFNVLDRLKFVDSADKRYGDIVPLITELRRCFDALGLPFEKLFIGCTTSANGVDIGASETVLHKLCIQSSNFYDEDNEPMSCREVVEAVLQPFGLMMLQRDGDVYIYDYNALINGVKFKQYNFSSFAYEGDVVVDCALGSVRFASTEATMGFEPLINNVEVTSSLYGDPVVMDRSMEEDQLQEESAKESTDKYTLTVYDKCAGWNDGTFVLYEKKDSNSKLIGCKVNYTANSDTLNIFNARSTEYILGTGNYDASDYLYRKSNNRINLLAKCFINARKNPFDDELIEDSLLTRECVWYCDLFLCDLDGNPILFYDNWSTYKRGWYRFSSYGAHNKKGNMRLVFTESSYMDSRLANKWVTNSNITYEDYLSKDENVKEKNFEQGLNVEMPPIGGTLKFVLHHVHIGNTKNCNVTDVFFPSQSVIDLLIDSVRFKIVASGDADLVLDDVCFKSYINRKVKGDYGDVTIKCCTANDKLIPIGRGNILGSEDWWIGPNEEVYTGYCLHLDYARNGKKGCLEELLMGTIHSNYIKSNVKISADIDFFGNPMMRFGTKFGVLSDRYVQVDGCSIDCGAAIARVDVSEFSADVVNASDIPYE